jgi:hypothetical protein
VKYVDIGVRAISSRVPGHFPSVMTPKNRRAEASFNLDDFVSWTSSLPRAKIHQYIEDCWHSSFESVFGRLVKLQSLFQLLKGVYASHHFLTIGFDFSIRSCIQNRHRGYTLAFTSIHVPFNFQSRFS